MGEAPTEDESENELPSLGDGSRRWLDDVLSGVRQRDDLPVMEVPWQPGTGGTSTDGDLDAADVDAVPLALTDHVLDSAAVRIIDVEVSDVPDGATLVHGQHVRADAWRVDTAFLDAVAIILPREHDRAPFQVTAKVVSEDGVSGERLTDMIGIVIDPAVEARMADQETAAIDEPEDQTPESVGPAAEPTGATDPDPEGGAPAAQVVDATEGTDAISSPPPDDAPMFARAPEDVADDVGGVTMPDTTDVMAIAEAPLEISVGIDDPDALAAITIIIDGVPDGGSLSRGDETIPGTWRMTGAELEGLAVRMPPASEDFVLSIIMRTPMGREETGEILVGGFDAIAPGAPDPDDMFSFAAGTDEQETESDAGSGFEIIAPDPDAEGAIILRLGAEPYDSDVVIAIVIDGAEVAVGAPDWSDGEWEGALVWLDIVIPWNLEDRPPAEIVVQRAATPPAPDDGAEEPVGPVLAHVVVGTLEIAGEGPFVAYPHGRHAWRDRDGMRRTTWSGDLVVDVESARAAETGQIAVSVGGADTHLEDQPVIGADLDGENDDRAETSDRLVSETPSAPMESTPLSPSPPPAEKRIMEVDLKPQDIAEPRLVAELVSLRDALRAHDLGEVTEDAAGLFEKLGIDPDRWRDVVVRDHRGRVVDLDHPALRVAPLADDLQAEAPLSVDGLTAGVDDPGAALLTVSGLPPGTLLSSGRNLGDGTWVMTTDEWRTAIATLPPSAPPHTNAHVDLAVDEPSPARRAASIDLGEAAAERLAVMPRAASSVPLTTDDLDPYGYGGAGLTFNDVPPGALLSRGTNHGDGVWTVDGWNGDDVLLTVPAGIVGGQRFGVTAMAFDDDSGETSLVSRELSVDQRGRVSTAEQAPPA